MHPDAKVFKRLRKKKGKVYLGDNESVPAGIGRPY
jgi:hypothetical protein